MTASWPRWWELIEGLHGQHALLFYWFQHDLARILAALEPLGLRVRVYNGPDDECAWNAGEVDILLAHPVSCCYGLNLQHGGHHIIWFGLDILGGGLSAGKQAATPTRADASRRHPFAGRAGRAG